MKTPPPVPLTSPQLDHHLQKMHNKVPYTCIHAIDRAICASSPCVFLYIPFQRQLPPPPIPAHTIIAVYSQASASSWFDCSAAQMRGFYPGLVDVLSLPGRWLTSRRRCFSPHACAVIPTMVAQKVHARDRFDTKMAA
jgi:hypothetical protein